MANQIRMTPDTMRSRAGDYGQQAEVIKEVIFKMDRLLEQLESEWEGEASKSYSDKYKELKPGFEAAEQLIRDIQNALMQTADAVERTDKEIASKFRA